MKQPQKRGLALMTPEERKRISSMGGKAVSKNTNHMQKIGRRGGRKTSSDAEFMSRIGKIGGSAKPS